MSKKNLIALLFLFFSILAVNQCYAVSVGDSYGGGTVFCVCKTSDITQCKTEGSGDYGLIMANEDQVNYDSNSNHGVSWSSEYKTIGSSAQSADNGATNTDAIIKAHPKDNPNNNAAWLCRSYKDKIEGHTDWYLPSKNELNKMYIYAKANNLIGKNCSGSKSGGVQCLVGGYENPEYKIYWSSSEYSGGCYVWSQYFSVGVQDYGNEVYGLFAARAVRAFNNLTIQPFNNLGLDQNQIKENNNNQELKKQKEPKKLEEKKELKQKEKQKMDQIVQILKEDLIVSDTSSVPIIPWDEITLVSKLGEGGFGIVYKGTWKHGGDVAIKQIKGMLAEDAKLELKNEAGIINKLNSPYIIRLFGLCWDENKYAMVMELMPNASLYHLLHSGKKLPWEIRYSIAKDVAYGLRFLHDRKILHRDLKSLNVLLDGNLRAKLSDFGLSKVKSQSYMSTNMQSAVGTIAWMAPELFGLKPKYSTSSDVYAYGITAWELASRELPYKDVYDNGLIINAVKSGEREDIPNDCPQDFAKLIESCWAQDPNKRMTMDVVVKGLELILKK